MTGPGGSLRIALADDHALFRDGLRQILELEEDFTVVGEAGDADAAVRLVERDRPDLLLLDVDMPGGHVRDTVLRVRDRSPSTAIVVLTMHDDAGLVQELVTLGVSGYVLKSISRTELVSVVRSHARNPDQVYISVSRRSIAAPSPSPAAVLSDREKEVLRLAAAAMSNSQIARQLQISEATVKRHMYNVFGKLGAVSRLDAVNKYFGSGGRT